MSAGDRAVPPEVSLLQGNQACARGAIAAGCRFFAGYPITPSSEIAEAMAALLPRMGGVFIQMEDEIASLAAVIGASLGGMKAMTATSGPGFSLMQEHVGFACHAEIPCVIVDVMRGGPSTGLPTSPSQADVMQARWGTHGDHPAVVLAPASSQEVFDLTVGAFNLAEQLRTPVILLYDEVIAHLRERVVMPPAGGLPVQQRRRPAGSVEAYRPYAAADGKIPPLAEFGTGYRFHVTGLAHDERGFPTQDPAVIGSMQRRVQGKAERHRRLLPPAERLLMDDAEIAVFAYGIAGRAAREAVRAARAQGIKAGFFRPRALWPFPDDEVCAVAAHVRAVVVAEMNLGQMIHEVARASRGQAEVVGCLRADGEPIAPEEILAAVETASRRGAGAGTSHG
ncbi:MAG: 2-oxoacid:acceptor oxidoreductase subunit alpha [Armatimonadetes bacterium]|nr:2-oxoacid:acceptor oxidoreductase subunit alpha [Armatimonadota bacterium]